MLQEARSEDLREEIIFNEMSLREQESDSEFKILAILLENIEAIYASMDSPSIFVKLEELVLETCRIWRNARKELLTADFLL